MSETPNSVTDPWTMPLNQLRAKVVAEAEANASLPPTNGAYVRVRRLRPGVWLYRCTRCDRELSSSGTGSHERFHARREGAAYHDPR